MNHRRQYFFGAGLTVTVIAHLIFAADLPLLWQAMAVLCLTLLLGALLVELLVGRSEVTSLLPSEAPPSFWERCLYIVGSGISIITLIMLLLSYLPGGLARWQVLLTIDLLLLVLSLLLWRTPRQKHVLEGLGRASAALVRPLPKLGEGWGEGTHPARRGWLWAGLLTLLLVGGFFRFANLGYAEFQGDEARATLRAAAIIQGYEDVLLIHKKGPVEILLPTVMYVLTGKLTESVARLPFALANLVALFALFLLGWRLFAPVAGWAAAMLLALDGYFIAFARIVQYQSIVFLMSVLVVLILYRLLQQPQALNRYLLLAALFFATGLLSHYEAVVVALPASYLLWLLARQVGWKTLLKALIGPLLLATLILLSFYLPFMLYPNFAATYHYLSADRIGGGYYNNLPEFFERTTLYSTTYYLLLLILLTIVALLRAIKSRYDKQQLSSAEKMVWLWFVFPFLLALFFVAVPRTHVYVFFMPWVLLAGMVIELGWRKFNQRFADRLALLVALSLTSLLVILFGTYAYWYFIYNQIEILPTWHQNRPRGYWTIYQEPNYVAIFGFPHQVGWKVIGSLYQNGFLEGPYDTNEERDWVLEWYTHGKAEQCKRTHRYFFLVDNLEWARREASKKAEFIEELEEEHELISTVFVHDQPRMYIYERTDEADEPLEPQRLQANDYASDFDATQTALDLQINFPVTEAPIQHKLAYRLENGIILEGYNLVSANVSPNQPIQVTLYWRTTTKLAEKYKVFFHLVEPDVARYAELTGHPGCDGYPTNKWPVGELIYDPYEVIVFPDAPAGTYPLFMGMYDPDTEKRLSVYDASGELLGDFFELTKITIEPTK